MKKSPRIKNAQSSEIPAYVSWDGKITDSPEVMKHLNGALDEYRGIPVQSHTQASFFHQDYSDLATNVSGRPGLSRQDYEAFRPQEAIPKTVKGSIAKSDDIYENVGLIRNIIDLMGDFGSQGIRITHPNKQIQKFYRKWFERVKGVERSERFLNNLYRLANVIVRIQTVKLKKKDGRKIDKVLAEPDLELKKQKINRGEIPFKYTFLNPLTINVVGGPLASFVGNPQYTLSLPPGLKRLLKDPRTPEQKKLVNSIPDEIKRAALTNNPIPLPQDKTRVFHYKKDDWQSWARPMIHAIMNDINILEKMKLADTAALDGAISKIRIFKLGNLEHKIAPTRSAAAKLAEILESNVGGGTMDLVWGPDIELIESETDIHQFLGEGKFIPHLNSIYNGLGIPPSLTGTGGTGTTNNFISLKTLMQRLFYGRGILNDFWNLELEKVQLAMGFRLSARVEYDIDNLGDEIAEKALLIQLADRNLISDELLQNRFGHDPGMETIRLNREYRERDNGTLLPKSSPWHDPQFGISMKKVALQKGLLTPGEVGLDPSAKRRDLRLFESNPGETKLIDMPKSVPGQKNNLNQVPGRPKNSKDKQKRKTKEFKPKTRASVDLWLRDAQSQIAKLINPIYLSEIGKKDMRNLTNTEMKEIEDLRFHILWNLKPLQGIDLQYVRSVLSVDLPKQVNENYQSWIVAVSQDLGRNLTLNERKEVQKQLYLNNLEDMGDENG